MVYASLLDSRYIASPEVSPGPVFQIWARRWRRPAVALRDVDRIEATSEIIETQIKECEQVWRLWKNRES